MGFALFFENKYSKKGRQAVNTSKSGVNTKAAKISNKFLTIRWTSEVIASLIINKTEISNL